MKTWLIAAVAVALIGSLWPDSADARRFGGARSSGLQRNMPERTAPTTTPATPAQPAPTQVAPANAAAATAAAPAAAAAKRSWLGPVAGLAAGLGLAALMSHLGLGEEFAGILMIALLAMLALAAFAFLRRRMAGAQPRPALAAAGAGVGAMPTSNKVAWPQTPAGSGGAPAGAQPAPAAASTRAFVPATFDSPAFERIAKAIFIRMQLANDRADLDDLRQFTTPEMYAAVKLDLLERGSATQTTEVRRVEASVVDVAEEPERQVVSVRYRGEIVEADGAAPEAFDEVWHLVRPVGSDGAWLIAGIEQMR